MPRVEDLNTPPSICLDPGMGMEALDFMDLTDADMPFARAAVLFALGHGPLEDVITEGRELEVLREWRALREKQPTGAPETPAAE